MLVTKGLYHHQISTKTLKQSIRAFTGGGHLSKCKANLSKINDFRDMNYFCLKYTEFSVLHLY